MTTHDAVLISREVLDELQRDAARFEWCLPILTAQGVVGDTRTLQLAQAFMRGLDGRTAIDAAMVPHD